MLPQMPLCSFDPHDVPGTIERCRTITSGGACPHIGVFEFTSDHLAVCAMMDSNCHIEYDQNVKACAKNEGSLLRLFAVKYYDCRNHELIGVVPFLRSYNASLLRFEGGSDVGTENVLHLKDRALWIGPSFQKGPSSNRRTIRTIQFPEPGFTRVPVRISVSLERESPYGREAGLLDLRVAIVGSRVDADYSADGHKTGLGVPCGNGCGSRETGCLLDSNPETTSDSGVDFEASGTVPVRGDVASKGSVPNAQKISVGEPLLEERMRCIVECAQKDIERLKEIETLLRYETDPIKRTKTEELLRRVEASFHKHLQQFHDAQENATADLVRVGSQASSTLRRLKRTLDSVGPAPCDLVDDSHANLTVDLDRMIERVEATIIEHLDATAETVVRSVLAGIQQNGIDDRELQELYNSVEEILDAAHQSKASLPADIQARVSDAESLVDATRLDVRHRLRVAIPIIPLVVTYMTDIELRSGLNITNLWESVVKRFSGR